MILAYFWSKMMLRLRGKSIRGSQIDRKAMVNYGSNIVNSTMGRYSYCGYDCWIIEADIGSFCSISNNVRIGGPSHPIDWVSTSPVFHSGKNMFGMHFSEHEYQPFSRTCIGNDVWIGECSLIKAGVKIGDGAVIGMGSVVTKDVCPYEIWAGNPARFVRKRFSDDVIDRLEKSKWYENDEKRIKELANEITSPSVFLDEVFQQ